MDAWDEAGEADDVQVLETIQEFSEEQPALMIFTHAQLENADDADDSPLAEIVVAIWRAMSKAAGKKLRIVPPEEVDAADEKNTRELEKLQDAPEQEWQQAGVEAMQKYNQRELYAFALEVLMETYKDAPDLAPDNLGMDLLSIKTVIDCLDQ